MSPRPLIHEAGAAGRSGQDAADEIPQKEIEVTAEPFLALIFEKAEGVVVTVNADQGSFKRRRWKPGRELAGKIYFGISTVRDIPRADVLPAQTQDLVATYVIVLDDVGTKVDPLLIKLAPTYKMRTSMRDGISNEQWGYVFETGVDPARAAALIEALAQKGLTDAGAKRADRIMRLPGSLNTKYTPAFAARLLEWHPERLYTFSQVCAGLGVTPTDTPALSMGPAALPDGMIDPIDNWNHDNGRVTGPMNPRGWYPITCPLEGEHTGAVDHGCDYKPGMPGVFKCQHEHRGRPPLTTSWYRAWILEQDPDADLDMVEALGARLREILGPSKAPAPHEEVAHAVLNDLIHVASEDKYWSNAAGDLIRYSAVDHHYTARMDAAGLLTTIGPSGGVKKIAPSMWLKKQERTRRVLGLVHRLGEPLIVNDFLNVAPKLPERAIGEAEPTPWLELISFICKGNLDDIEWLLDWCAMVVRAWDEKTGFHLILRGKQGTGKNLSMLPLMIYLQPHHQQDVTPITLAGQFTGFLEKRLVIVNEVTRNTRGAATSHDIYSSLKQFTARGANLVPINQKNRKIYMAADRSCWVLTTNESVPLPLDDDDRRFMVLETPRKKWPKKRYIALAKWIERGGYKTVVAWLQRRWDAMPEEDRDDMRGEAPMTDAKRTLISNSAEGVRGAIKLAIAGQHGVTWPDLMRAEDVYDRLKLVDHTLLSERLRKEVTVPRITMALEELGAVHVFGGKQVTGEDRKRRRLWCLRPDKAEQYEQLGRGVELTAEYLRQQRTYNAETQSSHLRSV